MPLGPRVEVGEQRPAIAVDLRGATEIRGAHGAAELLQADAPRARGEALGRGFNLDRRGVDRRALGVADERVGVLGDGDARRELLGPVARGVRRPGDPRRRDEPPELGAAIRELRPPRLGVRGDARAGAARPDLDHPRGDREGRGDEREHDPQRDARARGPPRRARCGLHLRLSACVGAAHGGGFYEIQATRGSERVGSSPLHRLSTAATLRPNR